MAFAGITNAQLAADQAVTQSLLRQFRENLYTHTHVSGQGGAIVAASLAEKIVSEGKLADRTITSINLTPTITHIESAIPASTRGDIQGERLDDPVQVTLTVTRKVRLFLLYYGDLDITSGATITNQARMVFDGVEGPSIGYGDITGIGRMPELITLMGVFDPEPGTYTALARYIIGQTANAKAATIRYRKWLVREFER